MKTFFFPSLVQVCLGFLPETKSTNSAYSHNISQSEAGKQKQEPAQPKESSVPSECCTRT